MGKSRQSADLVSDNNIFVDIVNDRVGMGTSVPAGQFHVRNGPAIIGTSSSTGTASQNLQVTGGAYISGNVGIGTTNPGSNLTVIGDGNFTGSLTATTINGALTGTATTALSVSPNSVGLGTDTTGDYVKDISGTANQITVTSGTGEGSSPTLSVPNQFTAPQDVEITRDLQVNRNLNVNGNITIGGTAATLFTTEFKVYDPDIVLGFRTDGSGNDISTDNTANHGGIAVASTEGTPLIQLFDVGIGETNPATYKKIMWFKSGTFTGLGTDAWISNYAIGIGSTQVPNGVRLSAGGMKVTDTTISSPQLNITGVSTFTSGPVTVGSAVTLSSGGINVLGVITATSFVGNGSGLTGAGSTVADITTNATYYPLFTQTTSGTVTASGVSTNILRFNPTTGLSAVLSNYSDKINALGNTGTSATINLANGNFVTATLTGNCQFTFTTGIGTGSQSFTLFLTNDATPSRSITWPVTVKWPGGSTPVRTETANRTDVYSFFTFDNGVNWYGTLSIYNYA